MGVLKRAQVLGLSRAGAYCGADSLRWRWVWYIPGPLAAARGCSQGSVTPACDTVVTVSLDHV